MPIFLIKYLPWIAGVLVLFGAGTYTGYHLNPWQARYKDLRAADAIERANGEEAVRKALQAQLTQAQAVSTNNAQVIHDLQNQNVAITAARDHTADLVRRLLASQARRPAPSGGVSQAPDQPGAAGTSPAPGDGPAEGLLTDAALECLANNAKHDALIAQLRPQL